MNVPQIATVVKFLNQKITATVYMFFFNICHYFSKVVRKGTPKRSALLALHSNNVFDPNEHFLSHYFVRPGKFVFEKYIFLEDKVQTPFLRTLKGSYLIYMVSLKMSPDNEENQVKSVLTIIIYINKTNYICS